ncbi:respiratory chain complex I subunit 1 family protein [archaeon]
MIELGLQLVAIPLGVGLLAIILGLVYKGVDRRIAARLQARVGPPLMQPFWDVRKLMVKETVLPENAVEWVYSWAPVVALSSSVMLLLYIPWGPLGAPLGGFGDLVLVAYLLVLPSLAMAAGGFASGSPYASIGAQREMVLMMSYEVPLVTMAVAFAWKLGTFSLSGIAANPIWLSVGLLGAVGLGLLALVTLFVIPAELSKTPFDSPEAETELAGGMFVEYSGRNLGLFYLADAVKTFAVGALAVTMFLPFTLGMGPWAELAWFVLKVFAVLLVSVTIMRVAVARLQIDKAARYYWGPMAAIGLLGLVLLALDCGVVL